MTDQNALEAELTKAIADAGDVAAIEAVRVSALVKQGSISALLKSMGAMSPDERREQGPLINGLRDRVSTALNAKKASLEAAELEAKQQANHNDHTQPAPPQRKSAKHPTMQVMDELIAVFAE